MIGRFSRVERARRHHRDLVSQFAPLLRLTDDIDVLARRDESISSWSVGEQLEHLTKVDGGVFERIQGLIDDPSPGSGGPIPPARVMLLFGRIPRGRGKSPKPYLAQGLDADEMCTMVQQREKEWRAIEPRLADVAASRSRAKHPILGAFDALQWLRFAQVHVRHHRRIIDDIVTASD